jgi:hypothetical protein
MGSLQRRLRGCMSGVRAEPFPPGSIEMTELELYLARAPPACASRRRRRPESAAAA